MEHLSGVEGAGESVRSRPQHPQRRCVQTELNMDLLTLVRPITGHMPELHVDPQEALKRAADSKDDRHSFVDIVGESSLGCEAVVGKSLHDGLFAAGAIASSQAHKLSSEADSIGLNIPSAVQVENAQGTF